MRKLTEIGPISIPPSFPNEKKIENYLLIGSHPQGLCAPPLINSWTMKLPKRGWQASPLARSHPPLPPLAPFCPLSRGSGSGNQEVGRVVAGQTLFHLLIRGFPTITIHLSWSGWTTCYVKGKPLQVYHVWRWNVLLKSPSGKKTVAF